MTGRLRNSAQIVTLLIAALLLMTACSEQSPDRPAIKMTPQLTAAQNRALQLCAGCHGPQGIGTASFNPNLACQKQVYMVKQLNDYREGKRTNHPPMTAISRMLSPQEVEDISLWYSLQNCQVIDI
ncbi:hypothetical protein EOPP23_11400 [Endozoicomonas sp. OPT23]|uniref:c-type cytochrome n=1 Tax=Endozoicomonas sp. OPT23 TaxID=2072845 RepID=UPI00129B21A3|nr:c-type cytochrome [Endozoicomonas sp. OPT23]MRI33592.1 hypothetical protein [Endozoicomonas sp. OPT23]